MDYRSIMSGRRKDPLAVVTRGMLRAASIPYGVAVAVRNRRYDAGSLPIHRCDVPVISVGNVTTGGTGKTPVVCYLAGFFRRHGVRVAIVSRGYGRGDADVNDEAMELHARLPDVPHVQDADRVEAARIAVEELDAELILMDDGFQHRRLHRDFNLAVIDATCPFGYGHLLPRGLLREPLGNLRRADFAIVTRCDAVDEERCRSIEQALREVHPQMPVIRSTHQPMSLLEYPDAKSPLDQLQGEQVGVLSAIGNPAAFEQTVQDCGATIIESRQLPDHDAFSPDTVANLRDWVQSIGDRASRVICTHKDLVKLQTDRIGGTPLAAILIELQFQDDPVVLENSLDALAQRARD